MYFLLPIPYLYCSFSLAGNVVAMTGHSKLTLMNSFIVATTNVILNIILIPQLGIIGAALASAIAMFILNSFEVIEACLVASTKFFLKDMIRPHIAGLMGVTVLSVGLIFFPATQNSLSAQLILTSVVIALFVLVAGREIIKKVIAKL
jgi:O-antigen/teichoic acid export membrane protein